jgi:UDPglucose--hexose-1-phosphate uridylyltransferase
MSKFDANEHPHIRFNPLKDDWVLVSPHRMKRPWQGKVESSQNINSTNRFDPNNPLCPGATRPNGVKNPEYKDTFVFDNDFPALLDLNFEACDNQEDSDDTINDLFKLKPVSGTCKVMCFHPYSDLTLPLMSVDAIVAVIKKWIEILNELSPKFEWVQIFENKGEINGCSNPHPHCQVWANDFLPNEIRVKNDTQQAFFKKHSKVMLVEYLEKELKLNERVVVKNEHWVVLVPYWAVWPYETMLLPKRHVIRLQDLKEDEITSLADIMKRLLIKYDNLFQCSFPYSMGFHFAPTGKFLNEPNDWWQLHASYLPPLLRSANIKKFMVGFELLSQPQRDLTPEKAASQLAELSDTLHYSEQKTN